MKYKGVIFDLDGVICFTDKFHYQAWKVMADKENIYFDEKINNRLRGVSRMESLEIILERSSKVYTEEEKKALATYKNDVYRKLLSEMTTDDLDENTRLTLLKLKDLGLKLSIGSSSKNAKFILERIGLNGFFDAVSDGTNILNSKPDPEVFLKAAQMLDLNPVDCLVVEDAFAGIDAASNGGFDSAAIGDASKYDKATYSIINFSDLVDIVSR